MSTQVRPLLCRPPSRAPISLWVTAPILLEAPLYLPTCPHPFCSRLTGLLAHPSHVFPHRGLCTGLFFYQEPLQDI